MIEREPRPPSTDHLSLLAELVQINKIRKSRGLALLNVDGNAYRPRRRYNDEPVPRFFTSDHLIGPIP